MDMTFQLWFLFVPHLSIFGVAHSVEGRANNNVGLGFHLVFIFFVEFYRRIFRANVTDFEIFKTVLVIRF